MAENILLIAVALILGLAFLVLLGLLISVVRSSRHHGETKRLQGGIQNVVSGRAAPLHDAESDPRFVEGMTREKGSGRIIANNRLSDDYIRNLLDA